MSDPGRSAGGPETDGGLVPEAGIVNGRYRAFATWRLTPDVVTYAAEDLFVPGRQIALEILRGEFAADAEFVAAVQERARALAKPECRHRGIARVLECDATDDGRPVVLVERIEGRTLREVLDTGALDSYTAVLIASQVGEALEVLHRNRIVHGELRPEAVVVVRGDDGKETVKLVGVELTAAHRTPIGRRLGDPPPSPYLAPEQREPGELTEASDIYALGRLLQELLLGTKSDVPEPSWGENRVIPQPLERIIAKALEARPQARYRNVSAMVSDMWRAESQIDDTSPSDSGRTALERLDGPATSNGPRARLAMVAAAIAIFMVGAIWIALGDRITSHHRAAVPTLPLTAAPTKPADAPVVPASDASVVPASMPSSALATPIEPPYVPSPPSTVAPASPAPPPTVTPEIPRFSERQPRESARTSKASRPVASAPVAVRESRPVSPTGRALPSRSADPVASTERPSVTEQPQRTEQAQRDAEDGSAIIDWLFNNRPGS